MPMPRYSGCTTRSWRFKRGRASKVESPRKQTASPKGTSPLHARSTRAVGWLRRAGISRLRTARPSGAAHTHRLTGIGVHETEDRSAGQIVLEIDLKYLDSVDHVRVA